jgi:hypothetical protein
MPDPPYLIIKMRDGTVHEGVLGRQLRRIIDARTKRAGYEVRNERGVWLEVWDDDIAEFGRKPPR